MFLHLSVILSGGMSRPRPRGEVGGSGWGVSRPRPGGRLGGLARGVSRPTPGGGGSRPTFGECPGPGWGEGGPGLDPGGVSQHALRQTRPPPQQTANAADGTHPTGMHSCLHVLYLVVLEPYRISQA